jgi:hypothetical protein
MPRKWVQVVNPANGRVSTVSERAFNNVWKAKGFTLVGDEPVAETEDKSDQEQPSRGLFGRNAGQDSDQEDA